MAARDLTTRQAAASELETADGLARHVFRAMGTHVSVLVPDGAIGRAREVEALFADWETGLSRFRPDSELSRLNAAAGQEVLVSDLLFDVTRAALAAAAVTGGLFDPTLLHPIVALGYDQSFELLAADRGSGRDTVEAGRPGGVAESRVAPEHRFGRWREVRLDDRLRSVTLPPDVGLDFGGIAKGMAVDAAIALLAGAGVTLAAVEAGGDLAVLGAHPEGGWPIDVEAGSEIVTVEIDRGGLATSTVGRRRWRVNGERRHHLLDPRTGRSAETDAWSVMAAAASCREAEVVAKCALLLGTSAGAALLDGLGVSGLITTTSGEVRRVGPWARAAASAPGEHAHATLSGVW